MASPSIDSIAVHGWQALLVVKSSDEMYGMIYGSPLPSMGGMQHMSYYVITCLGKSLIMLTQKSKIEKTVSVSVTHTDMAQDKKKSFIKDN